MDSWSVLGAFFLLSLSFFPPLSLSPPKRKNFLSLLSLSLFSQKKFFRRERKRYA
jgi:hypothetical protein